MNSTEQQNITTAARRIAREHNTQIGRSGTLAFDAAGRGGEWYSEGSWPTADIVFAVRNRRVTAREVQEYIEWAEDYS